MPTATVYFDSVGYKDSKGNRHYADGKGTQVDLTEAEYDRLKALGAVGDKETDVPIDPPSPFVSSNVPQEFTAQLLKQEAEKLDAVVLTKSEYEELVGGGSADPTDGLSDEEKAIYKSGTVASLTEAAAAQDPPVVIESGDTKSDLARKLAAAGYQPSTDLG